MSRFFSRDYWKGTQPGEAAEPTPATEPNGAAEASPKRNPAEHLAKWRFKPGQSGNPAGRPAGKSITAELNELGAHVDASGETLKRRVAKRLYIKADRGDVKAIKIILDRTEGRVKQNVELGGSVALTQTVFYIPDNGRDGDRTQGDPPGAGPADVVPGDAG